MQLFCCFHLNFVRIASAFTHVSFFNCRNWSCDCSLFTTFSWSDDEHEEVHRSFGFMARIVMIIEFLILNLKVLEVMDSEVSYVLLFFNSNFDEKLVASFCTQLAGHKGAPR